MSGLYFFNEANVKREQMKNRKLSWMFKAGSETSAYLSSCIVEIEAGIRVAPAHSHPNGEETVFILEGKGKALIGSQIEEIGPGSMLLFPQGVPHMLWNTGEGQLRGLCVYGPDLSATVYEYHEDVDFPELK
jgi:mannose-6-phosphate isomerase-like protein (cupin superfamily)